MAKGDKHFLSDINELLKYLLKGNEIIFEILIWHAIKYRNSVFTRLI